MLPAGSIMPVKHAQTCNETATLRNMGVAERNSEQALHPRKMRRSLCVGWPVKTERIDARKSKPIGIQENKHNNKAPKPYCDSVTNQDACL